MFLSLTVLAQGEKDFSEDTTQILLLEDINIQLEATEAINDMYNIMM